MECTPEGVADVSRVKKKEKLVGRGPTSNLLSGGSRTRIPLEEKMVLERRTLSKGSDKKKSLEESWPHSLLKPRLP